MIQIQSSSINLVSELDITTSFEVDVTQNISVDAPDLWALIAVFLTGDVDLTSITKAVAFDGVAADELACAHWGGYTGYLRVYSLKNPNAGNNKSAVASFSGLGVSVGPHSAIVVSTIYSGVESLGTPVSWISTDMTSSNVVHVTEDGLVPAGLIYSAHAVGGLNTFNSYNGVIRQRRNSYWPLGGALLVGDTPGNPDETLTAGTLLPTTIMGGIGIPMNPAVVMLDTVAGVGNWDSAITAGVYRDTPHIPPERMWTMQKPSLLRP